MSDYYNKTERRMRKTLDEYLEGPCGTCPKIDTCESESCEAWLEYQATLKE